MAPTASSYDLFLSYNSADQEVVEDVARRLRAEGLEPFLDRWYLPAGVRWRSKLENTLSSSKAVAIFVGPGEMGSWQQREVDVALDLQIRSPNLPVIPVLLRDCEPPLGFLRQLTWVDLRIQTLDLGVAILAKAARGEAPGPDLQRQLDAVRSSICPYRGLLHFREEDAPFFFGREAVIDQLMDKMRRQSFVAVVGASGSGKSSVLRAGLLPRLRSDGNTAWEIVILVPTDQPLKALARAFLPLLEPSMGEVDRLAEVTKLVEHFRLGTISLYDIVERIFERQSATDRVLIVVDQFEELYTLTSDEEARRRFLDELLTTTSRWGSKATVLLGMRGDFVGKALAYRPLSDRLQDSQINLGPMTRDELDCAIRNPAEKIKLEFESGLVRRILNDVGDEPGNLPLLEFVLKDLWDQRYGCVLLNESYDKIGGLQGAVATRADDLLRGLSSAEQKILQRVFLRIVRPSENGLDTRRRAAFTELPPEGLELVVKLAKERLLVTNKSASGLEQTVEVAHEALISSWGTLRAWVSEDREFLLWRDRLGPLVAEWERAQESYEALLRGSLLIEAQKWFDERSQDLSDLERRFISASREERERLGREEKERQHRELAEAEKRRREQAAAAKSLARLAWVLAAVALAAVGGAIFGFWQKSEAENQKREAEVAKAKANDLRDRADGLINFMLYDLRDKLQPIGHLGVLDDVAQKAKDYLDKLPKALVTSAHLQQQSAMLANLGDVRVAQGKLPEALDAYEQSLAISRGLAERDNSSSELLRELAISYEKVGDVRVTQGQLPEALDAYSQSLAITKRLAQQVKSDLGWKRELAISYGKVGDVLVAQGMLSMARDAYEQSLAITKNPSEQDKSDVEWQREVAMSYERLGDVLTAQGSLPEALDAYQQSLAICQRLGDLDKSNASWKRDLSMSYEKVGDVLVAQGKLSEARDAYQQCLAISELLAELDESNAVWQRDLALSHSRFGDVLMAQGDLPDALDAYRQDLAIAKPLAERDKSNAVWQRDLAVSHEKVGDVLVAQGKLREALDAYQQSLAIGKPLTERDNSNAVWQRDLIVSLTKSGTISARIGGNDDLARAQGLLRTALDLADKYSGPDRQQLIDALNQATQSRKGEDVTQDYDKARDSYLKAANAGNADAMNKLGVLYLNGRGVMQDYGKAREWFQKAADGGNTVAMDNLGALYFSGLGVAKGYVKAQEWFQKAADGGNTDAMNDLGWLYEHGLGVAEDYGKAQKWFQKAAEAGNTDAMNSLGGLYYRGLGVQKEYVKAQEWFQKAADAGNAIAMNNLGELYQNGKGVARDYGKAQKWFQKAADGGNTDAMNSLAWLYEHGLGVAEDYGKAQKWFQKAAEVGNTDAMNSLGESYQNGKGVAQDYGKAREWFQKAADAGNADAKQALLSLRDQGH